jgi:hypothetical protein
LGCRHIAGRATESKDFCKEPGVPVSNETSKFRVAVPGEQLDTVGCHSGERKCGGMVSSGSQIACGRKGSTFRNERAQTMRRKVAPRQAQPSRKWSHSLFGRDRTLCL